MAVAVAEPVNTAEPVAVASQVVEAGSKVVEARSVGEEVEKPPIEQVVNPWRMLPTKPPTTCSKPKPLNERQPASRSQNIRERPKQPISRELAERPRIVYI